MTLLNRTLIMAAVTFSFSNLSFAKNITAYGGVSGGGGNVIDPTPPDILPETDTVEYMIKSSLKQVHTYLYQKSQQFESGQLSQYEQELFAKVFRRENSILKALYKVEPEVDERQPCFDFDRQPVDASIATNKQNHFCVSAFTLRQKVIHSEIPAQSAALMIHEYSEIVGANEDDAVALQRLALDELKATQYRNFAYSE